MDRPSSGQYKILQKLGAGGMGTVYLAMDQQLKRMVAIKVLNTNIEHDSSTFKRFVREIEVTAQLNHPNIIKIYQVQTDGEFPQLIMEFIAGKSLMDYLADANLSLSLKLELMQKIALAVDHAHKKKIIHRDIKPSNIMVRTNGEPILMDFGIAKVTKVEDKSLTRSGEIVGTLQYMSPEQATGARRDVDHRTDIYSLGAVMYHILTGQMPITAPTFMDMLDKIVHEEPIPLRELNSEIPVEVESICLKALAKDKEKRYATAQALAADIENYLKGRKTTAVIFAQQQKWRKMGKKIALPMMILTVLALVLGIIFYMVVPKIMQSRHEQEVVQNITTCYQEAQVLLQSGDVEKKEQAYQKLLQAWNMGKQEQQSQSHLPLLQQILPQLRKIGYDLGVYWWSQDQDKSIVYFATLQDILAGSQNADDLEKITAVDAHLAYLRKSPAVFQKSFSELLSKFQNKQNFVSNYPEIVLLQAKICYQNKNYRETLTWLQLLPSKQYGQETLYYQGMCQYHLKDFAQAEKLLLAAYQTKDARFSKGHFQYDLILYLADSLAHQFTYQKIPVDRYQTILPMLEEVSQRINEMTSAQLQHYLEMRGRYNIEILVNQPERSAELAQQVLDMANRNLQNDPLYALSYLQRGVAYRYLGKFALAWADYDYAFQLDPQQLEAIKQMWQIFPYYMDVSDNYIERFNSMSFRWGSQTQVTSSHVGQEDFIALRQQYYEAEKKLTRIPFQQENFDKFYRNLFQPWKDIKNVAQSALISMVPHEETLKALEQAIQKTDNKQEDINAVKELQELIRKQQIKEQHIHWCYFISQIPHHGFIPQQTLLYLASQEPFLKFLRQGVLEQTVAPNSEMQNNWLLLQFLAARILAQLPSHTKEYGRGFLYEFVHDTSRSLELRIIVARALYDAGLTYLDHGFLDDYIQRPKSVQHGQFLDIQVASLLISPQENDRRLLQALIHTTPYQVVPMVVYALLPKSETEFLKDRLEPLCQKALQSEDSDTRMMAVVNFGVIERYREANPKIQKYLIDMPQELFHAIEQSQYPNVQKAALSHLTTRRNLISKECHSKIEKLLDDPNPTLRLLSIAILSGFAHHRVMKIICSDIDNFQEQTAFLYGLGTGQHSKQYLKNIQQNVLAMMQFVASSRSIEGRGTVYCISCYFFPCIKIYLGSREQGFFENRMQSMAHQYLQEKHPSILFWALSGLTGLDNIAQKNIQLIQKMHQDMTMPLHIRKIATAVLLYEEVMQNSPQQPIFEKIMNQIHNNLDDPDELWQSIIIGYKQALRNHYSDGAANYDIIGEANKIQTWNYYLLRFQRNIMEPDICLRFQKSLENIIMVLDLFPKRNKSQQEEWIKALYFLALLHIQSDHLAAARDVLSKNNRYLDDIRLSSLWIRMEPADIEKVISYWQKIPNLSDHEQAWLMRFQGQVAWGQRDYQQSNKLFLEQYIWAPDDPPSLAWMAENMLQQQNFTQAHSMVDHDIYLSEQPGHACWTKARICATQKDYDGAHHTLRRHFFHLFVVYPIRPQDLANPLFDGMNRGSLCYSLAFLAALRYSNTEVLLWLEQALQYKTPIPAELKDNKVADSIFRRYRTNEQFQKIWQQLEKLPKKK